MATHSSILAWRISWLSHAFLKKRKALIKKQITVTIVLDLYGVTCFRDSVR